MDLNINKKFILDFLDEYSVRDLSAALIEYNRYLVPEIDEAIDKFAEKYIKITEEDIIMSKRIKNADEEELIYLMRKHMSGLNNMKLRKRLLECENTISVLMKEKCIKNKQSMFIENALYFFLHSETNYCDWIISAYSKFCSEYLKSMFCLVIGFRGEKSTIPFLMQEVKRFKNSYPKETYDKGPLLAIHRLCIRYY